MKGTRKWLVNSLFALSTIVAAGCVVTGFSGKFSPTSVHPFAALHLVFPFVFIANGVLALLWLWFRPGKSPFNVGALLLTASLFYNFSPFHIVRSEKVADFSMMSFNTYLFGCGAQDEAGRFRTLEYLRHHPVDILCLQEANPYAVGSKYAREYLRDVYPYQSFVGDEANEPLTVYSRFPIVRSESLFPKSKLPAAAAYYIALSKDTICVINCHLEGTRLPPELREQFARLTTRKRLSYNDFKTLKLTAYELSHSSLERQKQVNRIVKYVQEKAGRHVVLCGDFNDGPNSYAQNTFRKHLIDAHRHCETGPNTTYKQNRMYVRIDNFFSSKTLVPVESGPDNTSTGSDHKPLKCTFKIQ